MSDTPRTDQHIIDGDCSTLSFTRRLERDLAAARERERVLRVALADACSALNRYGPQVSHEGPCGPDAGCDMTCMEVADFSELWGRLRAALAAGEERP